MGCFVCYCWSFCCLPGNIVSNVISKSSGRQDWFIGRLRQPAFARSKLNMYIAMHIALDWNRPNQVLQSQSWQTYWLKQCQCILFCYFVGNALQHIFPSFWQETCQEPKLWWALVRTQKNFNPLWLPALHSITWTLHLVGPVHILWDDGWIIWNHLWNTYKV